MLYCDIKVQFKFKFSWVLPNLPIEERHGHNADLTNSIPWKTINIAVRVILLEKSFCVNYILNGSCNSNPQ